MPGMRGRHCNRMRVRFGSRGSFSSHAFQPNTKHRSADASRNRDDPSIAVPSGGVQSLLEEADADVLLLYDCCHSASAPTCHLQVAKGGRTESIAACGFGEVAAEVDDHSFTKALTHTLVLASKQPPFTVGELHARILSQLKCWSAPLARDQDGNHTDRLEPQRRKTPIYSILSETKPRRSIVLGPLPPPTHQLQNNESDSPGSSSAGSTTSTPSSSSGESLSKKRKVTCDESDKCAQVLVIARVDHADLNTEEWANWIREMPSDGKEVHVEGRWDSFSTLLLLRMPVPVWNLLPDSPAYDFVGFVTSKNWATVQGTRLFESASAYQKSDAGRGSFPKSSTAVLGAGPVVMGDENLKDMKIERMDETPIQISGDLTPECENCRSNGLKCDGLKPCWGCTSSDMKCVQFLRRQQSKRRREPSPNLGFDFESTRRSLPDRPSQYNVEASGEELIGPKNNSESTSPECFVDPDWEAETMGLLKDMRIQLRDAETKSDTGIHPPESGPYLGSTLTPLVAVLTAAKAALTGASIIGSGLAGRSVEKAAEARTSGRAAKEGNPSSEALSWVKEYGDDTSSSTSRKDSQTNSRSTGLGGSIISGDNLSTSSATSTQHNPSSSTQSRNHGLNGQHGRGKSNMSQATQWYYVWICVSHSCHKILQITDNFRIIVGIRVV